MKTYSEKPIKAIPEMDGMYGMPKMKKMKNMESMYPMMSGMHEMPQMMDMQNMYHMMQCMCHMMEMHCMYHMMGMQGMNPMMSMQGMNPMMSMQGMDCMYGMPPMMWADDKCQMKPTRMQDDTRQFPIPMLVNLTQISPNQIQISYDRDVCMRLGTKPTNYWVQDTMNIIPKGIATLGKNETVNSRNSLMSNMVRIDSKNGSAKTFILTFTENIPRGAEYMLIICYVTVKGAPPYSGDNGMATFIGK